MKPLLLLALCLAPCRAAAQNWAVEMRALNGRVAYSQAVTVKEGAQANFHGPARVRGPGEAREAIFNVYLHKPQGGVFRLDYQAEVSDKSRARPPFQAQGKVRLVPGKPVLAAVSNGWKLSLELKGAVEGKAPRAEMGRLETALKCGRAVYPAEFLYLPDEQYTLVTYAEEGDKVRRYMVGLLPNSPGANGEFKLQYTVQLKDGSELITENQGELILAPGGARASAAAGKGCAFSASAAR